MERFCGVLLSCCPTLFFIKYLVSSDSNHCGLMFQFRTTSINLEQPALIVLIAKLFGVYFKNLFICIDELIPEPQIS